MRNTLRTLSIILLVTLAILMPVVFTGFSELRLAPSAPNYLEAGRHYQRAAQRIPWRTDLYELAGHHFYYAKEYSLANAAYQKAFRFHALSADGWVAWGDVNYLNDDSGRAAEIWEQALEQVNPSEKLYSRLAQIYQESKDYARAANYLQRYARNHLDDASAHYRLGLLLTLSDPDSAIDELIDASQLDPQFDPAVQTLRSALNLASLTESQSEQYVVVGRGLALVNEWDLALAAFDSATAADESNAEAWAWLGEAYQQSTGDETLVQSRIRAKEYLDRALSLNPNSAVVRVLRGFYFQRVGNYREALSELQFAATLQPQDPSLYVSIGESYAKSGDLIHALEAYQYATTLVPEDAGYLRLLAQFCAQNNIHVKDVGIPAAERAVVMSKDDVDALDLLGWLLLLDSRNPEAERQLLRALDLAPQNASVHFHLGMVYLQTDQGVQAYEHLVQARDLGSLDAQALLNQYFP